MIRARASGHSGARLHYFVHYFRARIAPAGRDPGAAAIADLQ
jgi:hypothetical protein